MTRLSSKRSGFTLLEVLLSISIIAIISGLSMPVYLNFQKKNDLDVAATSVANVIRRAQLLSQSSEGDDSWGIFITTGDVYIFKGSSYATRDTDFDEITNISSAISQSGVSEIVFAQLSGDPGTTGTITLSSSGETRDISVNEKGIVSY